MKRYRGAYILICGISLISCRTTYKVGESFEVPLEKHGLGGYQWEYVSIPEVVIVDSLDQSHKKENGLLEYTRIYEMQALERGSYNLSFVKKRSFEPRDSIKKKHIRNIQVRIRN